MARRSLARELRGKTARAIAAHRAEPTLDLSVKSDPARWAERLGGIVLPTAQVRLDTHKAVPDSKVTSRGMVACRRRRLPRGPAP